jgi:hypothetical protein
MDERHYVGVYWGDRKATKEACVPPILEMLQSLRAHDPVFARWYLKLATREESLAAEITDATARDTLEQGIVLTADEVPYFGWKVTLWNGEADGRTAQVALFMGAHMGVPFSPTPNSCELHMPRGKDLPEIDALLRRPRMTQLLGELARIWLADWGVVSTDRHLKQVLPTRPPHHPRVGWLTFLHGWRGRAPKLQQSHLTVVEGLGWMVGTHDEQFTSSDGSALGRIHDLEDALARAQRLDPLAGPGGSAVQATGSTPGPSATTGGPGYAAAIDAACAVDALSCRIPGRRGDLADSLLRASTALAVALATGDDGARASAELRALLDLVERLFPEASPEELGRAREALERVEG